MVVTIVCRDIINCKVTIVLCNGAQRCRDQGQAQNESPIDFVHSSRPRSRPRQGKVEFKNGLEPKTAGFYDNKSPMK